MTTHPTIERLVAQRLSTAVAAAFEALAAELEALPPRPSGESVAIPAGPYEIAVSQGWYEGWNDRTKSLVKLLRERAP